MSPSISLIITTYNRERYLEAAIESILNQTNPDFELLVWDDGSTDRSVALAEAFARRDRRVRVVAATHQGRVAALKAAIAQTKGTYLGWVDSDDFLLPTALAKTAAMLDANPEIGMVYTDYVEIDAQGTIQRYGHRCAIPYSKDRLLVDFMTFHFRLIRRSVFEQVGGIDGSLDFVEDYDLCLRLSEVTQVERVKQPLYYYRVHEQGASQQWRVEQVLRSRAVINRALERRGLAADYELQVELPTGRFYLRRKRSQPAQLPQRSLQRRAAAVLPFLATLPLTGALSAVVAQAQITPATDGTNTIVLPNGDRFDITGGRMSRDGANLFQSFQQFGLNQNQIANFLATPGIRNILGRVVGGDASVINGLIQVTGSNANLFLVNPAGIVFGANASLNVPGSFFATTANGIGFGNNWWSATGSNDYANLVGNPGAFAFSASQPGAVVNAGNLAVGTGQTLGLLGGTVVSTGTLAAPGGQVLVSAVPGSSLVRLSLPGNPLSLEIQPLGSDAAAVNAPVFAPLSLPQLLTGGSGANATGVTIAPDGTVALTGSAIAIAPGDAVVRQTTAQTATLSATRNLTLVDSQIQTTGDLNLLARDTLFIRDSVATPVAIRAGGNLVLQGDRAIDILALNHLQTAPFQSGGDLSLLSNGVISGDSHFSSGGRFSLLTLAGTPGTFVSFFDPIIRAVGNVAFGNYTGVALKIETTGSIQGGNIRITGPDTIGIPITDPDFPLLSTTPSVILRAGLAAIAGANVPQTTGGTTFAASGGQPTGTITVGAIDTSQVGIAGPGGSVLLSAPGAVTTGDIDSSSSGASGVFTPFSAGNVAITAGGNITTGNILASYTGGHGYGAQAGNVTLSSGGSINTGAIDASVDASTATFGAAIYQGGNVTLTSGSAPGSNITFNSIDARGIRGVIGSTGIGGTVQAIANGIVQGTGTITGLPAPFPTIATGGSDANGTVTIQHDGGPTNIPFTIGGASPNGTVGVINTGTIRTGSFPTLATSGVATLVPPGTDLTIRSLNTPPTLTAGSPQLTAFRNQPIILNAATLPTAIDVNNDVTTLLVDAVLAGTLTVNGVPVVPGVTTIASGDVLVYTPPLDFSGSLNAFVLRASDGVSFSAPSIVRLNVGIPDGLTPCLLTSCTNLGSLPTPEAAPNLQLGIPSPEERFTRTFEAYLGLPVSQVRSQDEQREIAQQIERATGARPAFIYVSFVPEALDGLSGDGIKQKELEPSKQKQLSLTNEELPTDQLEVLVVTARGNAFRRRIPQATRAKVLSMAQRFRREVSDPRLTRTTSYMAAAQQLYRWIVVPIAPDLEAQEISNLVFLMDAGLRSLPVAALHSGERFLVEQYSVGMMPSLSLTDTRYVDIRRGVKILGLGISESTQEQPTLPAVPVEVSTIVNLWSGQQALNGNATRQNLITSRQQQPFGIIHLATHADFQPGPLNNSYIQLWDDKLRLDQVRDMGWHRPQVELLVLSACATALGDREAELGFGGLAVKTGVKTAVASLWYVSDAGTTALMTGFYRELRTANIKAEALRQVQLEMIRGEVRLNNDRLEGPKLGDGIQLPPASLNIRDRQFTHPYYWAGFTMVGTPW